MHKGADPAGIAHPQTTNYPPVQRSFLAKRSGQLNFPPSPHCAKKSTVQPLRLVLNSYGLVSALIPRKEKVPPFDIREIPGLRKICAHLKSMLKSQNFSFLYNFGIVNPSLHEMKLDHPALVKSLQTAYSAERAASFAYIGHAGSLINPDEKAGVKQIEKDEWNHRSHVLELMKHYEIPVSRFLELKFFLIGKAIGLSCYFIGRFMPYFFAGKLESGNVCEYFVMIRYFHSVGITAHDDILFEMGIREKEHEVFFQKMIKDEKWLPWFEKFFSWGIEKSLNDLDLNAVLPVEMAERYCRHFRAQKSERTS